MESTNDKEANDTGISIEPVGNGDYNLVCNGQAILTVDSWKEAKRRQLRLELKRLEGLMKNEAQ